MAPETQEGLPQGGPYFVPRTIHCKVNLNRFNKETQLYEITFRDKIYHLENKELQFTCNPEENDFTDEQVKNLFGKDDIISVDGRYL